MNVGWIYRREPRPSSPPPLPNQRRGYLSAGRRGVLALRQGGDEEVSGCVGEFVQPLRHLDMESVARGGESAGRRPTRDDGQLEDIPAIRRGGASLYLKPLQFTSLTI